MTSEHVKILVVEDNPGDADLVAEHLGEAKNMHFDVTHESHLAGAIRRVSSDPFDVILLDLGLPDSQGLATVKTMPQACGTVAIIVLTGLMDEEAGLEAVRYGAQDYLIKGKVSSSALQRVVRYAMERKRLTASLHASELEYRQLFESARDGILILDASNGQIKDANAFLFKLLGYSKEELVTKKLWDIGIFQEVDRCKSFFTQLQQKQYFRFEDLSLVTKTGRTVEVELVSNAYPVGSELRAQCNIRDISDRVRADAALREQQLAIQKLNAELEQRVKDRTTELQAANKELEAFAYSVSHDLRAPLRAIDGFVHLLQDAPDKTPPEKRQHYLQMLSGNARQMSRLIDDLLRFSRSSRQSVELRPITPQALVQQCLKELQAEHEGRQIEVQIGALPECWGDGTLLKQVWFNLLSNAVKFTSKRDPARIEIGSKNEDGETVYYVKDNGVGFDMRYAGKLFGVFQRLHSVEEFEGTGIGLALVQRIIHRHGGRIWANARVEEGATFSFTLGRRPTHV